MKYLLPPFLILVVLVSSCATSVYYVTVDGGPELTPGPLVEPMDTEPEVTDYQLESRHGGTVNAWVYEPQGPINGTVALAHGFLRNASTMAGWARYFVSLGYRAITVDFIHSSFLGGNHDKNGDDLYDLTQALSPEGPVFLGGFSAGGLAATLAAAQWALGDEGERLGAVFGLDPVDSGSQAGPALEILVQNRVPMVFLTGEPSSCNASSNWLDPARGAGVPQDALIFLRGASHGSFENPYDPGTEGFCGVSLIEGSADLPATAIIHGEISQLLSSFVTEVTQP